MHFRQHSPRRNCLAIAKGAFTGAEQAALGHIRAPSGGTRFLDELYDLAPSIQAKLLRVIQGQQVVPLGETKPIPLDVTPDRRHSVPISELVRSGRPREDLLSRYSGGRAPAVEGRLLERLLLRDWPGNVRESSCWFVVES